MFFYPYLLRWEAVRDIYSPTTATFFFSFFDKNTSVVFFEAKL